MFESYVPSGTRGVRFDAYLQMPHQFVSPSSPSRPRMSRLGMVAASRKAMEDWTGMEKM